ncbi:MAG: hypothetical protein K2Z81_02980, partial [Cyanobacteria bacterium]|nr:hypothetical protein [Cyanobacteriota bacterium]
MSRWPSPQDYREAIQNPLHCFNDPDLRFSSVALDALQMPQVQCGNFAAVFKLSLAQQSWAVRCFLHDSDERRDRYRQISQYLQRCNLEEFVGFELIDRGIKFAGEFFPVLKMQFVEGTPLGAYIREKRQDPEELRSILDQFNSLMLRLKEAGIAHGDLQHDNIIVSDKKLKLVDYDGMYVPTMLQKESKELGHRNYQHPQRSKKHFGAYLDNFSAWLIRSSLECLIEKPSLFERLNKDDESILLDHKDLSSPYTSESFWQLEREGERSKTLSRRLRSLLLLPVEEINSIDNEPQDFSKLPPLIRSFASSWDESSVVVSPKQTKMERIEDVSDSMPEEEFICFPVFAKNDISDYSVLKPFSTVLLFSTSSESRMPYWSELQRRTRSTLAKDEKEIWTCLEFLSEPVPMNSFFARMAPDPAIKFSFIAAAGLFLLALFLYTA